MKLVKRTVTVIMAAAAALAVTSLGPAAVAAPATQAVPAGIGVTATIPVGNSPIGVATDQDQRHLCRE